ncbi:hypothetical protein Tco_1409225 [Tanacetum coccineum]
MNPQKTQQVSTRDEKWIPSAKRVKISSTNIRLETTVPQKEETFQVIINIIKNSMCLKAFTISADVPEIFMQQFWYTNKKVPNTNSYEFLFANKKCIVNVEVFRTILDICPRVEGVDFANVPDDDTTLTFLTDLGYKGPLNRHTNMFVDHMHQPWRTLAAIINKCLSGKTASNDKLQKSRIDIFIQNHIRCVTNITHPDSTQESRGKELLKKKTARIKSCQMKVTLSVDDNIISDDLDAALELAKLISHTKAEEVEAARKVHATHARIVTESVPESIKKKFAKLKGAPSLTLVEQEAANIMQALKESKKTSKRLPGTRGSNEGTGTIPGVLDESTIISATSSEGTGIKLGVPNEEKDIMEEKVILEWGDEQDIEHSDDDNDDVEKDDKDGYADDEGDDHVSDTQDADDEDVKTESDKDDIYKYKIHVYKNEDVEMEDAEVEETDKGDQRILKPQKEEAEKPSEAKDDTKKSELPLSS